MLVGSVSIEGILREMIGVAYIFLVNLLSMPHVIGEQCAYNSLLGLLTFLCYLKNHVASTKN